MDNLHLQRTDVTQSLLMRLHAANNADQMSMDLITSEPDSTATAYMFANAISFCRDIKSSLKLLQRANRLKVADEAVFVAAAKSCAQFREYDKAIQIIDSMIQKGLPFNKYSLSFVLRITLGLIIV